jgi:excisionase family DNA binding protein
MSSSAAPAPAPALNALLAAAGLELDLGLLEGRVSVSPSQACRALNIGVTRLYALLRSGELRSYHEGRSRRILTSSIRARVIRLLAEAAAGSAPAEAPAEPSPAPKSRPPRAPLKPPRPKRRVSTPAPAEPVSA